jgi:hypothetical protein
MGRFYIMTLILTIPSIAIGNVSVSIHKTQHYDSKHRTQVILRCVFTLTVVFFIAALSVSMSIFVMLSVIVLRVCE